MRYLLSLILLLAAEAHAGERYVWWEGEKPAETNFVAGPFAPANADEAAKLSAGAWLQTGKGVAGQKLFAKYDVEVSAEGTFHFWARVFYHHGPFRWRFDEQPWQTCDNKVTLADSVELRKFLCANWKPCGEAKLNAGKHRLHIELLAEEGKDTASAFDCFLLTLDAFSPRGAMKPGDKYGRAPEGWFAFEPDRDPFSPEALLDLRALNEPQAGSKGFLQAKGDAFAFEKDPAPAKFWAVCVGPNAITGDHASTDFLARRLAKLGVNLVRFHGTIMDKRDPSKPDAKLLDDLHYFQSALKKNGIYLYLAHYYVLHIEVNPAFGLPGYEGIQNKHPFGLLFFHPLMQELYRTYTKAVLTAKNPYTGLALAEDPALGLVEIQNEDGLLFWTFKPGGSIPQACMEPLEKKYGAWLARKYGSLEKAQAAWGPDKLPKGDAFADGRAALYEAGMLSGQEWARSGRNEARARDQLQFLAELEYEFYTETSIWLRSICGVRCPTIATNWTTVDNRLLLPLHKYACSATEVLDRHAYFTGPRITPRGYQLNKDELYQDRSALFSPGAQPLQELQIAGRPHTISEFNWNMPNRFRAEQFFLAATYGSLQGTDGIVHFAVNTSDWPNGHGVCSVYCPTELGESPAAALIYRKGYVKPGPVVVHEALRLDDLYAFKGSALDGPLNMDPAAKADLEKTGATELESLASLDPLAYCVGQVTRTVAAEPGSSKVQDLAPYIDREKKQLKSATGELFWDYANGLAKVDAPCAQGATGFLEKAGAIRFGAITIESKNEYGTVLAVSLDGKPLAESANVLVQVMTEDNNFGWKTTEVDHKDEKSGKVTRMKRVDDTGGPPFVVRQFAGTVTLARPDSAELKVTALDPNGYAKGEAQVKRAGGSLTVELAPDVLYYAIRK